MKKITSSARIVEIFSSEPLDVCESLLDVAQSVMKQRRGTPAKKARKANPADATDRPAPIPPRSANSQNPGRGDA